MKTHSLTEGAHNTMNTEYTVTCGWTKRGAYYPVVATCGHYEARYMASDKHVESGMPCTSCNPMGRPVSTRYDTKEACLEACAAKRP